MFDELISKVQAGLDKLDPSKLPNMEEIGTIDFDEHYCYQCIQAKAFASGRINLESASWIYATLGANERSFNRKPLAVRLAILQLIGVIS